MAVYGVWQKVVPIEKNIDFSKNIKIFKFVFILCVKIIVLFSSELHLYKKGH